MADHAEIDAPRHVRPCPATGPHGQQLPSRAVKAHATKVVETLARERDGLAGPWMRQHPRVGVSEPESRDQLCWGTEQEHDAERALTPTPEVPASRERRLASGELAALREERDHGSIRVGVPTAQIPDAAGAPDRYLDGTGVVAVVGLQHQDREMGAPDRSVGRASPGRDLQAFLMAIFTDDFHGRATCRLEPVDARVPSPK